MIAALYVQTGGCYFGLDGVDPWDDRRDARLYAGPWPVVAHPPCERWGRYAAGGPNPLARRREIGDDGGCFAAALSAVRRFGGVLEHPEASHAWKHFGIIAPLRGGGWSVADDRGGWTCCVEQGAYGHRARKATWLYAVNCTLPVLTWRAPVGLTRIDDGFHSKQHAFVVRARRRASGLPAAKRLSEAERIATPIPFRDVLLSIARSASTARAA